MQNKTNLNPAILVWAREQSGMSVADVAELAKISPLKSKKGIGGKTSVERLIDWETGIDTPTFAQLQALAKVFQRPIMTFFLNKPPAVSTKLVDFRTIDSRPHLKDSPAFAKLKRRLELLQDNLSDVAKATGQSPVGFVNTIDISVDMKVFVELVRKTIGISFNEQKNVSDDGALFRLFRKKIQESGVYVVVEGDLGSYHSAVSTDEFRGIAITDRYAPLIAINSKDWKQAQLFTLLHEFAHIWLGDSSVSNVSVSGYAVDVKEQFCNAFAAEMLLPMAEIDKLVIKSDDCSDVFRVVSDYARAFKVSIMVMARRLLDVRKISKKCYDTIISVIRESVAQKKQKNRETTTGINRDILDRYRLGDKVLTSIKIATDIGHMTKYDASVLLNINVARLDRV